MRKHSFQITGMLLAAILIVALAVASALAQRSDQRHVQQPVLDIGGISVPICQSTKSDAPAHEHDETCGDFCLSGMGAAFLPWHGTVGLPAREWLEKSSFPHPSDHVGKRVVGHGGIRGPPVSG